MWKKGEDVKLACEALKISRSEQYRRIEKETLCPESGPSGKLKELRLRHLFWGSQQMTAWL